MPTKGTAPPASEREKQVDALLADLRQKLIDCNTAEVSIRTNDIVAVLTPALPAVGWLTGVATEKVSKPHPTKYEFLVYPPNFV